MPPPLPLRGIFFLFLLEVATAASAQGTLVLTAEGTLDSIAVSGHFEGAPDAPAPFHADWLHMDGPTTSFTFRAEGNGRGTLALDELIVAGVEQYLDQRVHFTRTGVNIDIPVVGMVKGIDRLIAAATSRFGAGPVMLSTATAEQLDRVSRIDWSQATFGIDGGEDQEKYLAIYYYVRAQRQELERQLRNDLRPLGTIDVMRPSGTDTRDPGRTDSVPTVCSTVFDDENFLCPLDLKPDSGASVPDVVLTDELMANIAAQAGSLPLSPSDRPKLRKRDRWLKAELDAINGRIDKLDQRKELWALRDRMDAIEGRVDDLGRQVETLKGDEARPGHESDNPIADLSALTGRNITVHFASGSAQVTGTDRMLLEEVAHVMRRFPKDRALITGYADATGDPEANMFLSERRAKAVRGLLIDLGVSAERLLLNYRGPSGTGPDAAQRRVEIEWLP
jgi:outer membrane protein OmpA-like peptidoglycan-associated protein